ncbi:MAG: hypothetical protein IKX04_00195 [Clostridiales bacterium]|nr:hypothetical protein [Clostridiales bacterium]MBR5056960.1 hypothetical protein [Clostridiales bacterium]
MFRNRRTLYATLGAAAALLIGMLILFKVMGSPGDSRTRAWNYFNGYVDKVNERNYDIMYYGSEMGLPVEAKFRRIFNFEDYTIESEDSPKNHVGHILILYDPNDEYFLTEEQAQVIADLCENRGFRIVAIGAGKIRMLENAGIIEAGTAEKYDSIMTWKRDAKGKMTAPGIADSNELVPREVEEEIDPKYVPAYALVMELGTKELYWN